MKNFFESHIAETKDDRTKAYHVALGLSSLGFDSGDAGTCQFAGSVKTPEVAFHRASVAKLTGNAKCMVDIKELQALQKSFLNEDASAEDVFYLVSAMKYGGVGVDKNKVLEIINKIKAKDSTPSTMAYVFQTVVKLNLSRAFLKPFFDAVNDVLDQADELNGNQLFFEKGIFTTTMASKGIADLLTSYGEMEGISEAKLTKLINFLYIRRHSTNLRAAAHLAAALRAFSRGPLITPVSITLGAQPPVNFVESFATGGEVYRASPKLQLRLFSLWGESLTPNEVTVKGSGLYAIQGPNRIRVLTGPSERGLFSSPDDKSYFELSLASTDNSFPAPNWYELELSVQQKSNKTKRMLLGASTVQLPLRVLANPKIVEPVLKIGDGTHDKHQTEVKLEPNSHTTGSITIGQKMLLSFRLVDNDTDETPLTAHQAFVQFTHKETGQSITFVCHEIVATGAANAKAYQLKLDPESSSEDFDNLDGIYKVELFVGDSLFLKPIAWHMADLSLQFSGPRGSDSARRIADAADVSRQKSPSAAGMKRANGLNPLIGTGPTKAKPGIEHVFRPPERRAPRPLAWTFTALCAVPLLGLLIAWGVIGFNLSNFRLSLSAIIFHAGFIAILVLYCVYWYSLDMFTTLGYLCVLSLPTFLAGNSVLRAQLAARQALSGSNKK
ncbi:Oligosaccharyltransferase complex subunit delta [Fasciola gigantica]|uniref:Dolichyl-diphosphooligosaccharide--protein glycosyltransferase subunit 2 n=1 Tax=Fasciola gigantica TaxID=46835 RepID=A0A504YZC6_FASGI|nr:Oligosaccharyltransferase complex subunit delta [Fasciola gigantica]